MRTFAYPQNALAHGDKMEGTPSPITFPNDPRRQLANLSNGVLEDKV